MEEREIAVMMVYHRRDDRSWEGGTQEIIYPRPKQHIVNRGARILESWRGGLKVVEKNSFHSMLFIRMLTGAKYPNCVFFLYGGQGMIQLHWITHNCSVPKSCELRDGTIIKHHGHALVAKTLPEMWAAILSWLVRHLVLTKISVDWKVADSEMESHWNLLFAN